MTHPSGPAGSGPSGGAGTGPNRIRRPRPTAPRRIAYAPGGEDMPTPLEPPTPGWARLSKTSVRVVVEPVRRALSLLPTVPWRSRLRAAD